MTFAWYITDDYAKRSSIKEGLVTIMTNYDRIAVECWGSVDYVREGLIRHNSM